MQKKYLIILLVVVLVIIILILPKPRLSKKQPVSNPTNQTATSTETSKVTPSVPPLVPMTNIPSSQIPKAMPANLPFEKGAQILQNFEVKDPATGKTQSSRVYVSSKTIDANYAIYQKYLKDNGWTIMSALSQPAIKNFDATKAAARLDITIAQDDKGQVTVNVSYVD